MVKRRNLHPSLVQRRLAGLAGLACVWTSFFGLASSACANETPLTFSPAVNFFFPEPFFPTMFRARDLDGDGRLDVAVAGRDPDRRLFVLRGGVAATFSVMQILPADGFTDWLEFADLDRDGLVDLMTAWRGDVPRLVMYPGVGGGMFGAPEVLVGVAEDGATAAGMGRDPQGVAVGDFDGDGDIDVAVTQYAGLGVDVFTNQGRVAGALRFERTSRVRLGAFLGGFGYPRVILAGDVDGDGDLDLVANQIGGGRVAVLRNEGGRFPRAVEYRAPLIGEQRPGISSMQLVDLDGDGDLDIALPGLLLDSPQKIVAFVNDGSGSFTQRLVGVGADLGYAFAIACADFDGDGDVDAVTGQALPGGLAILRRVGGAPNGSFEFEVDAAPQFGQLTRHLDTFDVDGDCDLDIVGIDGPGRVLFVRRNTTPQVTSCDGVAALRRGGATDVAGAINLGDAEAAVHPDEAQKRPRAVPREPVVVYDLDENGVRDAADVAMWLLNLRRAPTSASASPAPVSVRDASTSRKEVRP
jgi:hypothetical protein